MAPAAPAGAGRRRRPGGISAAQVFCVEYARLRSGLAVFGDAKYWWARAKDLYTRMSHPVDEAVMVFSGSKRLKRGHVAVVTKVVSPREIIVDQANWMNKGEIGLATPVLDVSRTMTGARSGCGTSRPASSAPASMPSAALSPRDWPGHGPADLTSPARLSRSGKSGSNLAA